LRSDVPAPAGTHPSPAPAFIHACSYASPQTCTHASIQYLATIRGAVQTTSGHAVVNVRVTGLLLSNSDVLGNWTRFDKTDARRRREAVALEARDRRALWALNVSCPSEPAFDQIGRRLVNFSWPATRSGEFSIIPCPLFDDIVEPRLVTRTCDPDGRWAYPAGVCDSAMREFETATLPALSGYVFSQVTIERLSPLSVDLCGWECAYLSDDCVAIRYVYQTGACLLLSSTLANMTNRTDDNADFGFYRLKNATKAHDFDEATVAPTTEVWCTVENGTSITRFGEPALSIPDAIPGGLSYDEIIGNHFTYANQVAAVETLGCTHVEGNIAVMCPHDRTPQQLCDELTTHLYHEFLCKEPGSTKLLKWASTCTQGEDGFPQNNELVAFLVQKTLRTGMPTQCTLSQLAPVTSLYPLRKLVHVTGVVIVTGCQQLLRLDGAFARLRVIGGVLEQTVNGMRLGQSLVIQHNPILTGYLPASLPSLHYSVIEADVSENPQLCAGESGVDFPLTWSLTNNADPNFCGCQVPVATNFNVDARVSDGSCLMTYCDDCEPGTHGPCSFSISGDRVCVEGLDLLESGQTLAGFRCPAGTEACTPNLCHNVLCIDPPQCQMLFDDASPSVGTCDDGACLYDNVTAGVFCDDRNPATGPDLCSGFGQCVGQTSCVVAEMTGNHDATFGGILTSQADVDALRECVIIDGHLVLDCGGDSSIHNLSSFSHITAITGALIIQNCPNITSFWAGFQRLHSITGAYHGSGLVVTNNQGTSGCLSDMFPALEEVVSRVEVTDNEQLCTTWREWHDDWQVANSQNIGCGCTDSTMGNYNPLATIDDCSCVSLDPCVIKNITCAQDIPCYIVSCNSSSVDGDCNNLTAVGIDTECDDSNPSSERDTCQDALDDLGVMLSGQRVCRGELPAADVPDCQQLNYCTNVSECNFVADPARNNFRCDDGFGFTIQDHCNAIGECVHGTIINCYGGDNGAPVLEMRSDDPSDPLICQSIGDSSPTPGDVISFNLHTPDETALDSLQVSVFGRDLGSFTDLAEIQGHWKVVILPNRQYLDQNCRKSCYNKALARFRANELEDDDPLQHFLDVCGHPERHCNIEGRETVIVECFDRIDHEVCEYFAELLDCSTPAENVTVERLPDQDEIHAFVLPADDDRTVRFTLDASPAALDLRPQFGHVDIWHFDRRPLKSYATAVTDEDGRFLLEFLSPHPQDNEDVSIQRVVVFPFAYVQEGPISLLHQYQEYAVDVPVGDTGLQVDQGAAELFYDWSFVRHRDVQQLDIIDVSAFIIQGRVTYGDNPLLVSGSDCPAINLQICTYLLPPVGVDVSPLGEEQSCATTDADGAYTLQVLVGADLRVRLSNSSTEFVLQATTVGGFPAFVVAREEGYDVRDVTEDVPGLDFQLVSQTRLRVTYGGGAHRCLAPIGVGTLGVEMANGLEACRLVSPVVLIDTDAGPELDLNLPAANYTITLLDNDPPEIFDEGVLSFFVSENNVLPEEAQVGLTRTVLYQQGVLGVATFTFRATPTVRINSATPLEREDCFETESNDAVMIVEPAVKLRLNLRLFEEYLPLSVAPDVNTVCHNVTGSVVVMESVTQDGSGNGNYKITLNTVQHTAVRAFADVEMVTGLPELLPPHMKRIRMAYGQMRPATEQDWLNTNVKQGKGRIKGAVIVVGSLEFDFGRSFAIPEYVPFLILRDPPGGDSSSTFSAGNGAGLSFSVTRETAGSMSLGAGLGLILKKDLSLCVGLGAASCSVSLAAVMSIVREQGVGEGVGDTHTLTVLFIDVWTRRIWRTLTTASMAAWGLASSKAVATAAPLDTVSPSRTLSQPAANPG